MKKLILFFILLISYPLSANAAVDVKEVVNEIITIGDTAIRDYDEKNGFATTDKFSDIYFDVFEKSGLEAQIGAKDNALKIKLESKFYKIIALSGKNSKKTKVLNAWNDLKAELIKTSSSMGEKLSFSALLLQSFFILLREGFEAILVITALITYLRRQDANEYLSTIYIGVGTALIASVLTALAITKLFSISGESKEALEGITMLIAAVVLLYVSFWLISKAEAERWQKYIKGKISNAITKGNSITLGFAAFLAVYREGAETILFYQALMGQTTEYNAVLLGFLLAALALFIIYYLMKNVSVRLPIGAFFTVTAILLYYLAFSFTGNGIRELQEANWIGITPLDNLPMITWLGVYPTFETFSAQALILLPLIFVIIWHFKNKGKQNNV